MFVIVASKTVPVLMNWCSLGSPRKRITGNTKRYETIHMLVASTATAPSDTTQAGINTNIPGHAIGSRICSGWALNDVATQLDILRVVRLRPGRIGLDQTEGCSQCQALDIESNQDQDWFQTCRGEEDGFHGNLRFLRRSEPRRVQLPARRSRYGVTYSS